MNFTSFLAGNGIGARGELVLSVIKNLEHNPRHLASNISDTDQIASWLRIVTFGTVIMQGLCSTIQKNSWELKQDSYRSNTFLLGNDYGRGDDKVVCSGGRI